MKIVVHPLEAGRAAQVYPLDASSPVPSTPVRMRPVDDDGMSTPPLRRADVDAMLMSPSSPLTSSPLAAQPVATVRMPQGADATKVCAGTKRTGAAASVERRRREPAKAISPE